MNYSAKPSQEQLDRWIEEAQVYISRLEGPYTYPKSSVAAGCDKAVRSAYSCGADDRLKEICRWLNDRGFEAISDVIATQFQSPPYSLEESLSLLDKIQRGEESWDLSELDVIRNTVIHYGKLGTNK